MSVLCLTTGSSVLAVLLCCLVGWRVHGAAAGLSSALFLGLVFAARLLRLSGMWPDVIAVCCVLLAFLLLMPAERIPIWRNPGLESPWERMRDALRPGGRPGARRRKSLRAADNRVNLGVRSLWRVACAGAIAAPGVVLSGGQGLLVVPLLAVLAAVSHRERWLPGGVLLSAAFLGGVAIAAEVFEPVSADLGEGGALFGGELPGSAAWILRALMLVGAAVSVVNIGYDRRNAAILCMLFFPLVVPYVHPRTVECSEGPVVPFACILAGLGVGTLWRLGDALIPPWRRVVRFGVVALMVLVAIASLK